MLQILATCRRPQLVASCKYGYLRASTTNINWQERRHASTEVAATQLANVGGLVGFWQTLSNSTPVAYMQDVLTQIHDYSGLPWWASIVLSTFLLRSVVTLPLTIYQHKITARIEMIALEMPALVEELKREAAMAKQKFKWSDKQTAIVYRRSVCFRLFNCKGIKQMLILFADQETVAKSHSAG